jgi:hypothetical protein
LKLESNLADCPACGTRGPRVPQAGSSAYSPLLQFHCIDINTPSTPPTTSPPIPVAPDHTNYLHLPPDLPTMPTDAPPLPAAAAATCPYAPPESGCQFVLHCSLRCRSLREQPSLLQLRRAHPLRALLQYENKRFQACGQGAHQEGSSVSPTIHQVGSGD